MDDSWLDRNCESKLFPGSYRFLPIPYCLCWLSHLYQEQQNAMIQISETVAIVLLLKSP